MKRKQGQSEPGLKPITIRIRPEEYALLKEYADARQASLNTVVSEAISQYEVRIRREQTIREIEGFQSRIRQAHGIGSDSVELLRDMRHERTERVASLSSRPADQLKGGKRP